MKIAFAAPRKASAVHSIQPIKNIDSIIVSEVGGIRYVGPADGSFPPQRQVDSTKPLKFRPNELDRLNGIPGSATHCTLANAIRRTVPGLRWVVVMRSVAFVGFDHEVVKYELSAKAWRAVVNNDSAPTRLAMEPGSITFKPLRKTKTIAGKRKMTKAFNAQGGAKKPQGPMPQRNPVRDVLTASGVRDGRGSVGQA